MVFLKSIPLLFVLDSANHPIHAVGGVLSHFVFNKLATQPNREFILKNSPALVGLMTRAADSCFSQLDRTNTEFLESYAQFEIWQEEFEIAMGIARPFAQAQPSPPASSEGDFDIIGPHSV